MSKFFFACLAMIACVGCGDCNHDVDRMRGDIRQLRLDAAKAWELEIATKRIDGLVKDRAYTWQVEGRAYSWQVDALGLRADRLTSRAGELELEVARLKAQLSIEQARDAKQSTDVAVLTARLNDLVDASACRCEVVVPPLPKPPTAPRPTSPPLCRGAVK